MHASTFIPIRFCLLVGVAGQAAQGSVISAFESLHRRLRGLGLAMAASNTVAAVQQTYISSLVLHFLVTSIGTLSTWITSDTFHEVCASLAAAE